MDRFGRQAVATKRRIRARISSSSVARELATIVSSALDRFRRREIEKRLASDLQAASEGLRRVSTEDEKARASAAHLCALQRFADFAARGSVPDDLRDSRAPG